MSMASARPVRRITVIGAGVIGTSWAALFRAHGLDVVVHDVAPDAEQCLHDELALLTPTLDALGLNTAEHAGSLRFEADLARAVAEADLIQENGPDRIDFKRRLWRDIEAHAPRDCLFLSSSSGIPTRHQARSMRQPGRLMIGHPFNPPHLIPLVEVVPHKQADDEEVERAMAFYRSVGKVPMRLRKEVPGFVANRLQAALLREALLMVKWGVATVDEVDAIVTHSIGLRWATGGPFVSFHMGGGPTGFRGFLKHFARGVQLLWLHSKVSPLWFSRGLKSTLLTQMDHYVGERTMREMTAERDRNLVGLVRHRQTVVLSGNDDGTRPAAERSEQSRRVFLRRRDG